MTAMVILSFKALLLQIKYFFELTKSHIPQNFFLKSIIFSLQYQSII
jgi:hypothetical protein